MIAVIIQARMGSKRLPAKIMLHLPTGRSVLEEVIHNCKQSGYRTLVASDMPLLGIADYVGPEHDVWQRYVDCAEAYGIDVIARVTADCPLLTGDVVKNAIDTYLANDYEYVYTHNDNDGSTGEGYDVEVFSLASLFQYGKDKEHVTGNLREYAKKLKVNPPDKEGLSLNNLEDYIKIYRMLQ